MAQQPKSSFPTFETGTYEENGLTFFTVGSDGNPYYKVRADGSFFCNYNTYNGEEQGPPGSVAPDGLPLLVHAFGGDPGQLPAIFLDNGDPNPDALVEDGWEVLEIICIHCGHEWIAVVPAGVFQVECPNCGKMT